jgi:protein O-GlcNAc transferase
MTVPSLPVLTFPDAVADFVRQTYASARVILEYGSGGSTFVAAQSPGKRIISVESDPGWAERMRYIAAGHSLPSPPEVVYADIGPVGAWARALDHRRLDDFIDYARGVWESPGFEQPDVVLVDGRFRAACFMTTYLYAEGPVTLLFDDYIKRKEYHVIERLGKPARMVGRMAVFELRPEDRLKIAPWLLVATYFDAVCSFRVGRTSSNLHLSASHWRPLTFQFGKEALRANFVGGHDSHKHPV